VATAQPVSGRRAYVVTYRSGRTAWRQLPGLAGDDVTEASAILPDGSAIAGEVCSSGDHACASHAHPPMAAIWVRYGTDCNAPPRVLPTGNAGGKSVATSIARANKAIVAAGSVQGVGAVVWPLGGRSYLHLTGTASFPQGVANDIAHGPGGTFYVAGTLNEVSGTSVMEAVLWTISCTRTTCRQTRRTILNRFGEAFAVNGQGVVAGYSRPNGDGAGFDFIWQNRLTTKIPADPLAINNSGEIGAVSVNMKTYRPMAELLEPLASPIRPALACHRPTVHGTPAGNASL
jgi:hypothetical protein